MITHSTYLVTDKAVAKDFLSHIFGFVVLADEMTVTGDPFLVMGDGSDKGVLLQIVECGVAAEIAALKQQSGIVDYIFKTEDLIALVRKIELAGMKIVRTPLEADYGITAIFEDPFGNLWDLVQR